MQAGWIRREEEYIQVRKDCSVVSHKTNSIVDGPGQLLGPFSCLPQTVTWKDHAHTPLLLRCQCLCSQHVGLDVKVLMRGPRRVHSLRPETSTRLLRLEVVRQKFELFGMTLCGLVLKSLAERIRKQIELVFVFLHGHVFFF